MEKERNTKIIAVVALIVGIAGISVGFAAFSRSLDINVAGTINPLEDNTQFTLVFANSEGGKTAGSTTITHDTVLTTAGATGSATIREGNVITDIEAQFSKPGDTVVLKFWVTNTSQFIAYLKTINFTKTAAECTPNTAQNIDTICPNMTMEISVGGNTATMGTNGNFDTNNTIAAVNNTTYSSHEVILTLRYNSDLYVDEAVTVDYGAITLGYSTSN